MLEFYSRQGIVDMEIQTKQATVKGPAETFTGDVWFDVIVRDRDFRRMRGNVVRFAPCARTAWHAHPRGQTLYVTDGRGLVQSRGGEIIEIRPGDVIYTPPGEWHWHGAAPYRFMTHIAMWEVDESGASANWGEHVSDAEYRAQAQSASKET
jgi:quercetin dioxygenase-like cupin family protein